ncbi:MAG: hypothetical protein RLZZ453_1168 [Chlamydiota bacterium]|jgi:TrmH family RNA methyltransferase
MLEITSLQNPKLKAALRLFDRKERDETGLFLIEGYRELCRACEGQVIVETLFICRDLFLGTQEDFLIARMRSQGAQVVVCTEAVLRKLSYRDRPDGLIAIAKQMKRSWKELPKRNTPPFFVVAESIEKPGNLGTILRSCDAAGVHATFLADRCTDLYNPNVVRASVGTLFTTPVFEVKGKELLEFLKASQVQIVAATPSAQAEFTQVDLRGPIAIAVGTEQLGLSPLWMQAADIQVKIPMHGVADSLNVATATTLLLYEVLRQRR